jgi:MerR family Zn(II)-responsive transcriptional regulator of zntA
MDRTFQIGDVADELNISQRTVRYYEELGLISAERSDGGYRVFNEAQIERLRTILALKEIGMPLEEIRGLLKLRQHGVTGSETSTKLLEYLKTKTGSLKETIKRYNSVIKELEDVIKIIEGCKKCHAKASEATCERCVDDKTRHHVPPLMKSLLRGDTSH